MLQRKNTMALQQAVTEQLVKRESFLLIPLPFDIGLWLQQQQTQTLHEAVFEHKRSIKHGLIRTCSNPTDFNELCPCTEPRS